MIPFNKPYFTGHELKYIMQAVESGQISGDGIFTQKCHEFFRVRFGFRKCLMTTSCTDALEMCALLIGIQPGDEVIMPSFTFVSTANAFVMRGANIIFADSADDNPNIDGKFLESLITHKTRAIVAVHYAGVACDMEALQSICTKHNLYLIEDAAQAIDSKYKGKPLGSFGQLATFSFHETKNVISGEGGMLVVNDEQLFERAEIIREKGTNRSKFFRGEIDKYGWIDIGSSYLPSDLIGAFLLAQLENLEDIQSRRKEIWERYFTGLVSLQDEGMILLPSIPDYATNNYHMFYLLCRTPDFRTELITYLKDNGIQSVFHYQPLHLSPYYESRYTGGELPNAVRYAEQLVRLPFYYELSDNIQDEIIRQIRNFCNLTSNHFVSKIGPQGPFVPGENL